MPKTLQGYRVSGFPEGFSKILTSWFAVIRDYTARSEGDALYWYNERTNTGAFASALSRNRHSVLEEFGCQKKWKKDKWNGRADISFYYHGIWYLAEVKRKCKLLSGQARGINTKAYLEAACNDAKSAWHGLRDHIPFGMTFVVPWIQSNDGIHVQEYVDELIAEIEDDSYCDFWAYCAPGKLRTLQAEDDTYHPMILVLGKKI